MTDSKRRSLALSIALLLISWVATAEAELLVISSGFGDGYYHEVATRLATVLRTQYETVAEVHESNGSLENLGRLMDPAAPVSLALVQADALAFYTHKQPRAATELEVLSDIGRECAFLVAAHGGSVSSFGDLRNPETTLALPIEQSGARVTFAAMKELDAGLRRAQLVKFPGIEALLHLQSGIVDAVLFVQRPRAVPPIEIVLENQNVYRFISIPPTDLPNTVLSNGDPAYTYESVELGFARNFSAKVDTVCTRGLLVGSLAKLTPAARDTISRALVGSGRYILPGAR
jgi:TRAP-type uncharacterized transport system substrate-binding protein